LTGKTDVYRRTLRALGAFSAMFVIAFAHAARAQDLPVTRLDLPIGRAYPYRANEVITRVTVANPSVADAVVVSEREIVVNAAAAGEGDLIVWLQSGARVHFRVQVHTPADRMQIALAVKFAEVRRDALRELGVSALYRDKNVRAGMNNFNTDAAIDPTTGTITRTCDSGI